MSDERFFFVSPLLTAVTHSPTIWRSENGRENMNRQEENFDPGHLLTRPRSFTTLSSAPTPSPTDRPTDVVVVVFRLLFFIIPFDFGRDYAAARALPF